MTLELELYTLSGPWSWWSRRRVAAAMNELLESQSALRVEP